MCTRSSSNLPVESSPNPTTSNPKRRNRRCSKQPFILEESPIDTMTDQRTMAELLRTPTEGYAEAIVVSPILAEQFELKHGLINMMTSDQFFGLEKDNPRDHIRWFNKITFTIKYKDVPNSAIKLMLFPFSLAGAAHRWLKKEPSRSILTWEDLVSKFINEFFPPQEQQISVMKFQTFNNDLMNHFMRHGIDTKISFVHALNMCLAADGNTFSELLDNIQGYVSAAAVNYNQGNSGYCPPGVADQIRPLGFAQPNVQNNQNRFSQPQGYNRGNNFNQDQSYQALTQQNPLIFFQMNTASTLGLGHPPSNAIANPKGELKAITTQSDIVLDGPSVPIPPPFINPEEDERVEETLTDQDLAEDPLQPNIPYPSRMHKKKQQEKDEVQIHKFWQMFKRLHINITFADALILISKYQKMLKALISNKKKLLEMANTPLNENCLAVILKKLPEKLGDPGKLLIPCGFCELKCKALADLADFVIVDYESDPRAPLILGRPFLRTAHALIDVHGEEMILHDGDERLTLNMRHDTSSYSNQPQKESINMINIYDDSSEDFLENLFATNHQCGNLTYSSHPNLTSLKVKDDVFDPEGGNVLIEKLLDLDSTKDLHPPHINDDLPFDIESDLKEIEYLLNNDPIKEMDSILEDSVDEDNLANLNVNLADTMAEMFTDEHAFDYSSYPLYDEYDDDLFEVESDTEYVYDDPFDSKGEKIKESELLINELDLSRSSDFPPSSGYDSFLFEDFFEVDALPSTNNEDKVFNLGILIRENLFEVITHVAPDKNVKKIAISHASLSLEDFNPPLYELPFFKEVLGAKTLLSLENVKKVFKPGILTSKGVQSSLIPKLSHQGYKIFKIIKILKSSMEIFLFSHGEDIHILDLPCAVDPTLFTRHAGNDLLLSKYASEIVKKYGLNSTDFVDTPMIENKKLDEDLQGKQVDATLYHGMIGSLMHLIASRPDLSYDVCLCARNQAKPTKKHLQAIKRIFRYLNGTINMGLWYSKHTDMSLTAYADADHEGCQDTRRSTSESAQFLGEKLVSWSSKKQKSTAISISLYCDNKSAIALCCNNVQHSRAKHIDVHCHFIKEQVKNGIVKLYFLDLELVPKENRLDIRKGNGRIPRGLTPREPTFQVVLDAIGLTPCYPSFLITADVREVYMHQFWNSVYEHDTFYRFKLDKKKQFKLSLEVFRDIFQICPRVHGRDFDALPSEEDTVSFLRELDHTREINSLNDVVVDQMHQPWRSFAALINRGLSGKTSGLDKLVSLELKYFGQENMYYPRFTKAIIHHILLQEQILSWRNKFGMHTSKDDYLINTLRFFSAKESTQIYGKLLPETLTSPEMKESKAYKTYLGYALGAVPPKIARKFKKASPSKKYSSLVPVDDEPSKKGKRVKRSVKKSTTTPATGIVIREAPVKTQSKRKEKVDVARGKGIDLLSEVALTEEAQMKEVRKKSLRDFHKTHPSGSGTVSKKQPRVDKITPTVTSEGTGDKPGVPDVTEDYLTESESESWGNDEDDSNDDNNSENEGNDEENKSDDDDKTPSDSEKGLDYEQDANRNESDSKSDQQEYKEEEVKDNDEEEDEIVHTPSNSNEEEDANIESKNDDKSEGDEDRGMDDTTNQFSDDIQDKEADVEMTDAQQEKGKSHTARITKQVKNQPPQILPEEVSKFAPPVIKKMIEESLNQVNLVTAPSQLQSTYEAATTLTEFELKKILINKMNTSESYLTALEHWECYDGLIKSYNLDKDFFSSYDVYSLKRSRKDKDKDKGPSAGSDQGFKKRKTSKDAEPTTCLKSKDSTSGSSKGTKSHPKSSRKNIQSEVPEFEVANTNMPQDQGGNMGNEDDEPKKESACKNLKKGPTQSWLMTLAASSSTDKLLKSFDELMSTPIDFSAYIMNECHKALSKKLDWENPEGGDYPFELTKPFPLVKIGNRQKVPADYFFNNDLKAQRKTFYAYAQGLESTHDVYSTKHILVVTRVDVMKKHRYGYLREIEVRRVDNVLYTFKEGDFPRLRLNHIEEMLILIAQNRLTNLSGDDVADFAIALKMFTRSLVI
uniref:Retrotransposon gag domain-containing protein n=1 Tax=Tanacetum cinerariifolium TaxID=118510 RepID=A0A6L2JEW8_TANCI|nr:hypothetical protein [Tanacetum cinerariifolium]